MSKLEEQSRGFFFILFSLLFILLVSVAIWSYFNIRPTLGKSANCHSSLLVHKEITGIQPFLLKNNNPIESEVLPEKTSKDDQYLIGFMVQSLPENGYLQLHLCNKTRGEDLIFTDGEMHKTTYIEKANLSENGYGEFYKLQIGKMIDSSDKTLETAGIFHVSTSGEYEVSIAFSPDGKDWYIAAEKEFSIE